MRLIYLFVFIGAACSDPDPLIPKEPADGCNGCTIDQPVEVTGEVGVAGVVRVANEADGVLDVRVRDPLAVQGPVDVTGSVSIEPPQDALPVAVTGTVPVTGIVAIAPNEEAIRVALEQPENPLPVSGVVAVAPPEQPLPVVGGVTVRNEPDTSLAVRVEGAVAVEQPVAVTLPEAPLTVNGAVAVRNPPGEALAVAVEGSVSVDGPVAVTLPDEPVRCVIENNGNQQNPQGTIRGATFRGITQTLRGGDVGMGTLNSDCHTAFPRSRICTDQEILFNSFPVPTVQSDAWIFSRSVGGGFSSTNSAQTAFDRIWNGALYPMQNCQMFQNGTASYWGLTFTAQGTLGNTQCDQERVVACCGI